MKVAAALLAALLTAGVLSAQTDKPETTDAENRVIAVVLGKKLTVKDKDNLDGLIFGALLERFAKENKIEPTEQEIDTFVIRFEEQQRQNQIQWEQDRQRLIQELKNPSLSEQDRKKKESQLQTIESILNRHRKREGQDKRTEEQRRLGKRHIAHHFVTRWKINKALYAKYGGRVIFQQAGVEPVDAYRDFLKEQEKEGAFEILDKEYEKPFWRYFTNDAMHTFYSGDDGAKFINTPWWMMEQPADEPAKPVDPGNAGEAATSEPDSRCPDVSRISADRPGVGVPASRK